MGVELPLCVVVTILECCVTFSGVKLSIRSFVLFINMSDISECNYEHAQKVYRVFNLKNLVSTTTFT